VPRRNASPGLMECGDSGTERVFDGVLAGQAPANPARTKLAHAGEGAQATDGCGPHTEGLDAVRKLRSSGSCPWRHLAGGGGRRQKEIWTDIIALRWRVRKGNLGIDRRASMVQSRALTARGQLDARACPLSARRLRGREARSGLRADHPCTPAAAAPGRARSYRGQYATRPVATIMPWRSRIRMRSTGPILRSSRPAAF
jgi:hypothetical protein